MQRSHAPRRLPGGTAGSYLAMRKSGGRPGGVPQLTRQEAPMADYSPAPPAAETGPQHKSIFTRLIEAVHAVTMREIDHHCHLLPDDLERAGNRLNARSEDALPFGRP